MGIFLAFSPFLLGFLVCFACWVVCCCCFGWWCCSSFLFFLLLTAICFTPCCLATSAALYHCCAATAALPLRSALSLLTGEAAALSLHDRFCLLGLGVAETQMGSSIDLAVNAGSSAPVCTVDLPQEGISPWPFFQVPGLCCICLVKASGKVAGVKSVDGIALRPQVFFSSNSVTKW